MKAPTWGIIVGSLMLLLGACGAFNDIQLIQSEKVLAMQESIVTKITHSIEKAEELEAKSDSIDDKEDVGENTIVINQDTISGDNIGESIGKLMQISDYMKKWMVRFGYMGLIVSAVYFLGGLFLIMIKDYSIRLAYGALILSICFGIFQMVITSMDDSSGLISWASNIGYYFSIGADIVLLAIVFSSDKSDYQPVIYTD